MTKINNWLSSSIDLLSNNGVNSSRLDALLLLEHVLDTNRAYIHAHQEDLLTLQQEITLNKLLRRRIDREPIAYILGYKEFYRRKYSVDTRVLIPRPESETIIDIVLSLPGVSKAKILDIGTGSGALAITLKCENPDAVVHASDISEHALEVARTNALNYKADIHFIHSDLLKSIHNTYDIIIANLPYVSNNQYVDPETHYEPSTALYAKDDGLRLIYTLFDQAKDHIRNDRMYVVIEAEPRQHNKIIEHATLHDYSLVSKTDFILLFAINN